MPPNPRKPSRTWKCQRVTNGRKCAHVNTARARKCRWCGKPKPARRQPAHRAILNEMPYEAWVERFGETCGICGAGPLPNRRLDRDHDHRTGKPRGLLCRKDNRMLKRTLTSEWMTAALAYLRRAEEA